MDLLEPLDPQGILETKKIIKDALNEQNDPDATNLRESSRTAELFEGGTPQKKFGELARKERKHRL